MPRIRFEGMTEGEASSVQAKIKDLVARTRRRYWQRKIYFDLPVGGSGRRITDWDGKEAPFITLVVDPEKDMELFVEELRRVLQKTGLDIEVSEVRFFPRLE